MLLIDAVTELKELTFSYQFNVAFSELKVTFVRIAFGYNAQSGIACKLLRDVEIEYLQVFKG